MSRSHKLPVQTGTPLVQYPVMWPDVASHVAFSAPIKLYPSLHRILHVAPYELSHFPSINPFRGGSRVWHFKTTEKKEPERVNIVSADESKVENKPQ